MMYDVIVVGAGPAGSSAAYELSKKGLKTLLLDKRKFIGQPKQCAEGLFKPVVDELNLPLKKEWIERKVDSITVSDTQNYIYIKRPSTQGFVLDRKKFDPGLVEKAQNAGAEFHNQSEVIDIQKDWVILKNKKTIKTRIIIGADGPLSTIAQKSGLGLPQSGSTIQYELIGLPKKYLNSLQIFSSQKIIDSGWAWVFPKKETMNIGLGSYKIINLKPHLKNLIKMLGFQNLKIKETNSGLIPLHGPQKRFCQNNILLIGDAAGHTNPLTGGGIPAAIFDGQLTASLIAKHFENDYSLENYQKIWQQSNFGQASKKCLIARNIYLNLLRKGSLDRLLNKVGSIEVYQSKELLKYIKHAPLLDIFPFYQFGKIARKYFKYTA